MPLLTLLPNLGMGGTEAVAVAITEDWIKREAVSNGWVGRSFVPGYGLWGEVWGDLWSDGDLWEDMVTTSSNWTKRN